VAKALLEHETIDGEEVGRLVDDAAGRRVGGSRRIPRPETEPEAEQAAVRPASMAPVAEPQDDDAAERAALRTPPRPRPRPAEST
jgi:hypothetical protein